MISAQQQAYLNKKTDVERKQRILKNILDSNYLEEIKPSLEKYASISSVGRGGKYIGSNGEETSIVIGIVKTCESWEADAKEINEKFPHVYIEIRDKLEEIILC